MNCIKNINESEMRRAPISTGLAKKESDCALLNRRGSQTSLEGRSKNSRLGGIVDSTRARKWIVFRQLARSCSCSGEVPSVPTGNVRFFQGGCANSGGNDPEIKDPA